MFYVAVDEDGSTLVEEVEGEKVVDQGKEVIVRGGGQAYCIMRV